MTIKRIGSLFTSSHTKKKRDNGYDLHEDRFHLNTRKKFFAVRITATTSLGVEVSSPEILKTGLNRLDDLTEAHTKGGLSRSQPELFYESMINSLEKININKPFLNCALLVFLEGRKMKGKAERVW